MAPWMLVDSHHFPSTPYNAKNGDILNANLQQSALESAFKGTRKSSKVVFYAAKRVLMKLSLILPLLKNLKTSMYIIWDCGI